MTRICRYICRSEMAPVLEAALAADGYTTEMPYQKSDNGDVTLLMRQGAASVLLLQKASSDQCEIDVWGVGQHTATTFLDALGMDLEKLSTVETTT